MSNQKVHILQTWAALQPHRVQKCSDAFWNMPTANAATRRNTLNFRYGQLYNKKLAFMRKQAYMPGEGIARESRCPLCRQPDSGGHILGGCGLPYIET